MERIVVAHCHHSTTEVPLHVGNRFHAEKRCSPCPSHAFSFHRCVGNGAITPPSSETIQHLIIGMGKESGAYMDQSSPPSDDGDILVIEVDGKATPTATEAEL